MNERMKVITPRHYQKGRGGEARTQWLEIGSAWSNERQGGVDIVLHVLPIPDANGEVRILVRPIGSEARRDEGGGRPPNQGRRDDYGPSGYESAHTPRGPAGDHHGPNAGDDDNIPF